LSARTVRVDGPAAGNVGSMVVTLPRIIVVSVPP
jgi:hypothetical protein